MPAKRITNPTSTGQLVMELIRSTGEREFPATACLGVLLDCCPQRLQTGGRRQGGGHVTIIGVELHHVAGSQAQARASLRSAAGET